jgi:hemerythrin superfamily protein
MTTTKTNLLEVRGNSAVEILINDHKTIKKLLSDLTKDTDAKSLTRTMEDLKAILTVHNATEENLVYPAIRTIGRKKAESSHLYHETAEADVLVFQLDTMLKEGGDSDTFREKAIALRDAVLEHIEDEETSAFPHLQEKAEPDQDATLTQAVREFRGSFRFEAAPAAR